MKKIIVTGGAGFLGSHLCKYLLNQSGDYFVYCIDNLLTGNKDNLSDIKNSNFEFIEADVIKPLSDTLKADYIFHLASPASPNHHSELSYFALPIQTMQVNTIGTFNLLEFAKKNNASFLFASTSEIYGDPLVHPQPEDYRGNVSTTGPRSIYDEAKRFGETVTAYYSRSHGVDTRIARIFNTYGPNMSKPDMRMIITFINQAIENKPITVFGDGSQTRSLCYVDDLIDGIYKLMFDLRAKNEIINLGSDKEHTVLDYANLVIKLTQSQSEIVYSEGLPVDDPKKRRPDITKAKNILNWEPKINIEEGLKKTISYFKK